MYNDKINDKLMKIFENAIHKHEFFEYLIGKGDYRFIVPSEFYSDVRNDMYVMMSGIEYYYKFTNSYKIGEYLFNELNLLVDSNDISKIYTALNFITVYSELKKSNDISFNLNILPIIQKLKPLLLKFKDLMLNYKDDYFSHKNGMWQMVEIDSALLNNTIGHKVL